MPFVKTYSFAVQRGMRMIGFIKDLFKKETVFCASLLLAVLSAFAIRPDKIYFNYPDYRTISLLFCLMLVVSGFKSLGIFEFLGGYLLKMAGGIKTLSVFLMLLCFFSSMVITNDVTLITFVPFTMLIFKMIGREDRLLKLTVLEAIAANLGSMATPIGNPQNLYLFSISDLSMGEFFLAVLPYAGISLLLLLGALFIDRDEPISAKAAINAGVTAALGEQGSVSRLAAYLFLLLLCLLVVFRVLSYLPVLICVILITFFVNRSLFKSVDYFLLLTFLCFFIFIGNLKRIPELNSFLMTLVGGHELSSGILASQVISNVPAAILLSGFTDNIKVLITAVNLGGLGTLIASLASLIAFKFYAAEYPESKGSFLKSFTLWNLGFLLILTAAASIII